MGFWSSVSSFVSSVVSTVGSFVGKTLSVVSPIIERSLDTWTKIGMVVEVICTLVDILKPDEKVEEIGGRAIQASEQGIKPDDFGSYEEYMEAIRNFELDPKKSESFDQKDLLIVGTSVCSKALDEKLKLSDGTSGYLWLMAAANPDYFSGDRLHKIITSPNPMEVIDYFSGKLGPATERSVESRLVAMEKAFDPDKSEKAIFQELDSAQDAMRSLNG